MNKIISIALLLLSFFSAKAQYNVAMIPDSLKKDADYIIWEDLQDFKVINEGEAEEYCKFTVTVTNKYASGYNSVRVYYSNNIKLKNLKVSLYDAGGNRVKRIRGDEIQDLSAISGSSMFADNRMKVIDCSYHQFPYTIEYEYSREYTGLLQYPAWNFQTGYKVSVLSSTLKVTVPKSIKLYYKEFNLNNSAVITENEDNIVYFWNEKMLPAKEKRELSPDGKTIFPLVFTNPNKFKMDNFSGSFESWSDFALWNYNLNKGRDVLPEATKTDIIEIAGKAKSDKEKVKLLYRYMQSKTRYISVQIGIGGWQTFPADYVDKNGYGDCKALSNYMHSMLKEVGIKSHYTLVNAGRKQDDILTEFPSNQFNHAILCVPLENDTVWLECTDQTQPFNFLGSFTQDRHVLLTGKEGGKIVKTPRYGKNLNTQIRTAKVSIDQSGDAEIESGTLFTGLRYEYRDGIQNLSVKEQKEFLNKSYSLSGMKINNLNFDFDKDEIPSVKESISMSIPKFASLSGKRIFIDLNVFDHSEYVPERNSERKLPFKTTDESVEIDSISFNIPSGYKIESLPRPRIYETKFGTYSSEVKQDGENVVFIRKFSTEKGVFQPEDYKKFYAFKKKIRSADNQKLAFVKE